MTAAAPAIVVHSLAHAVAALEAAAEAGEAIVLLSAVDAGLSAGAGWWREMVAAARDCVRAARMAALLDCGDDAGAAQAALREGIEAIVLSERPEAALDLGDDFFAPPDALRRRVLAMLRGDSADITRPRGRPMPRDDGTG
jgi:hypothetical protein